MPLDTSIPLQFQATQAANPMAIYNAMQEQRYNALRGQALEQEMIKNALIMQNSQEDRARAAQERAAAAANAAKYRGIINQFGVTPAVTGQRGVGYSGTGVSNDPYAAILPDLVRGGFIEPAKELSELKNKGLTGEKLSAETAGVLSENQKKKVEAVDAQLKQLSTNLERVSSVPEVFALFDGNADAIRATGKTPEMSKQAFADLVGKVGFQQAIMQVSQGVMKTQEHVNTILTGQAGRTDVITGADGNTYLLDKASGTVTPTTMAAAAGAPAAVGAPAAAGAPASFRAAPTTDAQIKQAAAKEALPGAVETAELTLKQLEEMVGSANLGTEGNVPEHPGFQSAVGASAYPAARYFSGTDTSDFEKRLEQVKGGAFLKAYETLKGTGQITEKEGEKATAAITRMDTAQSEKEFITAAKEFAGIIRNATARAKTKLGGASAPSASSAPSAAPATSAGNPAVINW